MVGIYPPRSFLSLPFPLFNYPLLHSKNKMATVAPASLKRALSQSFSASLEMPPTIDQITPEQLASVFLNSDPEVALHIIDVRQPEEFAAGHIRGSQNLPIEAIDMSALCATVHAHISAGRHTLVVFVSAQSPDIDLNCALSFVQEYQELGLDNSAGHSAVSFTRILLGGLCYWLQQYSSREDLTESFVAAKWIGAISGLPSTP